MAKILLIEDDPSVSSALEHVLQSEQHSVVTASDTPTGMAAAQEGDFDLVITDLQMPGGSGIEVIKALHAARPHLPVILMTAHHTTEIAIEATKFGAYDYIRKPIDFPKFPEFFEMIDKAAASKRLMDHPVQLPGESPAQDASKSDAIVGNSRAMQAVYKEIGRVAAKPVTVLIRGETGTGKELVARAIFQHSSRFDQPFVVVNCPAIPEALIESELFGHEPGAFTDAKTRRIGRFEQADHGTIFLDEIGDMSLVTQVKMLRVLQDKIVQRLGGKYPIEVDVRFIAATSRDLEQAIADKVFREDLFYRLNVATIHLPPLRERREDIPELVNYFLRRHAKELDCVQPTITAEAVQFLEQQPWPGNVRELANVVRKALLMSRGFEISLGHIREVIAKPRLPPPASGQTMAGFIADLLAKVKHGELESAQAAFTEAAERELYSQAIQLAQGNQAQAAKWLGVSRPTMREKLTLYSLHPVRNEKSG